MAMRRVAVGIAASLCMAGAAAQQGQVNVICSVQAEWCNVISTVYARTSNTLFMLIVFTIKNLIRI